ncbi:hypothetical protein BGZ88_000926 [Linnemannia elongata]|nr:hypothetical protein BGZ88_000926 [Linnemannia elongata]
MGRNKSSGTPKGAPPSPRRTPTHIPPPRSTNETKGHFRKNPVAARYKNTDISMNTGTNTENTTIAPPSIKNIDRKRLRSGDRSSSTPDKARKINTDLVNVDPLLATKCQRKTQTIAFEERRVQNNDPVQSDVVYTIPVLVVTKKHNNGPEVVIQSHNEGPTEDMDLDEGRESTTASSSESLIGANRSDATPKGDGLNYELRERCNEVLIKIAIMAMPIDEATPTPNSSKSPPAPTVMEAKSRVRIVKPTRPVKLSVTTATSTMVAEPMVTVTETTTAVKSYDITAHGTAKDVDIYGSVLSTITIDDYGSTSNPITIDDPVNTVDNTLTTESTTIDANLPKRGNPILIALGENTRRSLLRTYGPVALYGWRPPPHQGFV